MVTHPSSLAWEIPWTEEPGGLESMGLQKVRHDLPSKEQQLNEESQRITVRKKIIFSASRTHWNFSLLQW